jgi:hypothetical protein
VIPRPPRRTPRREPVGVHRPLPVAPDTVADILDRGPMAPYVAGGQVPADVSRETSAPPLRKDQIARLEALTAVWERRTRLEGPADATLLYSAPKPPPPPVRARLESPDPTEPVTTPPAPDEAEVAAVSAELLAEHEPPAPVPSRVPGVDPGPASGRVSDWSSRHDPASLEYGVRERLGRAVPVQDVTLDAGRILDQGTAPPLSVHDAAACVGMACTTAANALAIRAGDLLAGTRDEQDARELYRAAQERDRLHGEDYAGTSVLAGMLAGRDAGLWDGFLWALRGTRDIAQVLIQLRLPVVVGIPWSAGLENPGPAGVIAPGGSPLGGHALAVVGLRLVHGGRPGPWFELQQSRGPAEGQRGRVFLHHKHLAQLLAGVGEAAVPFTAGVLS